MGPARFRFTGRAEGHLGSMAGEGQRRAVVDLPWVTVHQVHGARVVDQSGCGEEADAVVTAQAGLALAVITADCAPVLLSSPEGVIGAVHAGWRGLLAGVIPAAVEAMRGMGAVTIEAALGPCIHAECYEFSEPDLDRVASVLGGEVRGVTSHGRPALDVPAAVRSALGASGVRLHQDADVCTACSAADHFSHRARRDSERQAGVIWMP